MGALARKLKNNIPEPDQTVSSPKEDILPWMNIAVSQIGVKEVPGSGNNPKIIEYDSHTTLKASEDSVAWCAAFLGYCLDKAHGVDSTVLAGNKNAWAQSYASFGTRLAKPQVGCIVVFRHSATSGHVTFCAKVNSDGTLYCLGGNQSDQVKYSTYGTDQVIAYRWPKQL